MEVASNFIGGEWSIPEGALKIVSVNPADTRETICVAPDSPASEIDRAVKAALAAYAYLQNLGKKSPAEEN